MLRLFGLGLWLGSWLGLGIGLELKLDLGLGLADPRETKGADDV